MPTKKRSARPVKSSRSRKTVLTPKSRQSEVKPESHINKWIGVGVILFVIWTVVAGLRGTGPLALFFASPSVNRISTEDAGDYQVAVKSRADRRQAVLDARKKANDEKDKKVTSPTNQQDCLDKGGEWDAKANPKCTLASIAPNVGAGGAKVSAPQPLYTSVEAACNAVQGVAKSECTSNEITNKLGWKNPNCGLEGGCAGVAICCTPVSAVIAAGNDFCSNKQIYDPADPNKTIKPATGTTCTTITKNKLCVQSKITDANGTTINNGDVSCPTVKYSKKYVITGPLVPSEASGLCCY